MFHLFESTKIDIGAAPAADAGGRSGRWTSLADASALFVLFVINQGNAAVVPCSIEQARDNAGTGAKACDAVPVYVNQDYATSDALVRQALAANAFSTSASLTQKLVGFFVPAASLDADAGYRFVRGTTGASNAANITQILYVHTGLRYGGDALPSYRS